MKYLLAAVLVLAAAGGYYNYFYPPRVKERIVARRLDAFAQVVATKDRAKIGEELHLLLTPDAKVHLEVGFVSLVQQETVPSVQDFDTNSFASFIDNLLYSFTDYAYQPELKHFTLNGDGTAAIRFFSNDWADGPSWYGGNKVDMRFAAESWCDGSVTFASNPPQLKSVDCRVSLRAVPKPGQEKALQNPELIKQLLR